MYTLYGTKLDQEPGSPAVAPVEGYFFFRTTERGQGVKRGSICDIDNVFLIINLRFGRCCPGLS